MFKEAQGDEVRHDSIPLSPLEDYRISPDDKVSFTVSPNNGTTIVEELTGVGEMQRRNVRELDYLVRRDGTVDLPLLGNVKAAGFTVKEFEDTLMVLFANEYQEPFVQVKITNQRVIVFPGNGSDAKVIPLINTNTTLMEAIAQAGGITERGKAKSIKLMRKENGKRVIYVIDLSTIEGLKYTDLVVQANDYIYIEPTPEIAKEIAKDVVPIVSLLSSALVIFSAVNLLK